VYLLKWLVLILGVALFIGSVYAQSDTDTITVDVNVLETTVINIVQDSLSWTGVTPGEETSTQTIDVKNVGSKNVTGIYGYVDTLTDETSNPTGSSNPQSYAAGGVLTLKKNNTGEDFWFAGRLEWNYTDNIELISLPSGADSWGWFHNTSYEYVWALAYTGEQINSTHGCNTSNTLVTLRINKYKDNGTAVTRDVSGSNSVAGTFESAKEDWGIFKFSDGPLNGYCVATYIDCSKLYIYKYDRRSTAGTEFGVCTNSAYLNTTEKLLPGNIQKIGLNVRMPYGIPSGNLKTATLTIFAES